jgi:hypothetical protein
MNDLGLISVMPASFLVALLIVTASFSFSLTGRPLNQRLLWMHVTTLILILYGTLALTEDVPRQVAVWRHLGIADYIMHHGSVDTHIDAYFNWPGFFTLLSFLTQVAGVSSFVNFANWAPVLFNLFCFFPIFVLFRSGFRDPRAPWIAVWVFYCGNWTAQDHLSPQGFSYFLYLTMIAILVGVLVPHTRRRPRRVRAGKSTVARRFLVALGRPVRRARSLVPLLKTPEWIPPYAETTGRQRSALVALLVTLFAAITISHQLTPYGFVVVAAAIVMVNGTRLRTLPLSAGVIALTWFTYAAVPFLTRFLHKDVNHLGEVSTNVASSLGQRIKGSPEHLLIVNLRVTMTLLIGALAIAGALHFQRKGGRAPALAAMAAAPVILVALQPYGGEVLLRSYYFALPALAFFIAALVMSAAQSRHAWLLPLATCSVGVCLLAGFLFTRYGNERLDYFTQYEYSATGWFYSHVPSGGIVFTIDDNLPWRYVHYRDFQYHQVALLYAWSHHRTQEVPFKRVTLAMSAQAAKDRLDHPEATGSFLVVTKSMQPQLDFTSAAPPDTVRRFSAFVEQSPRFQQIYRNRDATIYRFS